MARRWWFVGVLGSVLVILLAALVVHSVRSSNEDTKAVKRSGVLLMGDSIAAMASGPEFARAGWAFNAFPGRTTPEGTKVARKENASTREVVIVALGTNDYRDTAAAYGRKIDQMMDVIGPGPRVIWVNVDAHTTKLDNAAKGVNPALTAAAGRYQNLQIADWNAYVQTVEGTPGLRAGDGIHYDLKGSELRRTWTLGLVPR